jgi:hypothetical protein
VELPDDDGGLDVAAAAEGIAGAGYFNAGQDHPTATPHDVPQRRNEASTGPGAVRPCRLLDPHFMATIRSQQTGERQVIVP